MANKAPQERLPATDSGPRPGAFPLGSAQSRAAVRSMVEARDASEEDEIRFQMVSILDGKPVNLSGLAESIRAARMRVQNEELPPSDDGENGSGDHSEGTWEERLAEQIRRARERVARAQGPETMP
jgi:hypothetical protein